MDIENWYKKTTKDDSMLTVAEKAGITQSTLYRQMKSGALSPEVVVAIARAYGVNVLHALVTSGLLTTDEIKDAAPALKAIQLEEYTDLELAEEIYRRVANGHGETFKK